MARSTLSRFLLGPRFFILPVLAANLILWLVPSDVVELVAREQHVLCGRYSRTHFTWILATFVVSATAIFLRTAPTPKAARRRLYALLAVLMVFVPSIVIADAALRLRTEYPYMPDKVVYHRPPNKTYHQPYEDKPEASRSYESVRPGYGKVNCTLTYDANGFRNAVVPAQCDVVAVGDSFTEGSRVSDDQSWPARLARLSGRSVYNLGVSGYSPAEYAAATKQFGLPLKPKLILCMLYEGNDFRSTEVEVKTGVSALQLIKTSPLLMGLNSLMIRICGPINANGRVRGLDMMSWMPIGYPAGSEARFYAFAPKQLLELNVTKDEFASSEPWFAAKGLLREFNESCKAAGAQLVIVYAPNKAHVVFPLAASNLPADKVRAFAALRSKKKPPAAAEFIQQLVTHLESREAVVAEWCASQSIPFISLTAALREYAKAGKQTYYTYDQHWTPVGHEAAARSIHEILNHRGAETQRN